MHRILILLVLLLGVSDVFAASEASSEATNTENTQGELTVENSQAEQPPALQPSLPDPASKPVNAISTPTRVSDVSDWSVVALTLVAIVALILALGWGARRLGGLRAMGVRDMRVVAAMPLGTRERLAVVQVQGKRFLLGVTAHQISHLHTFDDDDAALADADAPAAESGQFMQTLQSVLAKTHSKKQSEHES